MSRVTADLGSLIFTPEGHAALDGYFCSGRVAPAYRRRNSGTLLALTPTASICRILRKASNSAVHALTVRKIMQKG